MRKAKVARDFDAFLRVRSGERIGWEAAAPNDVFDWLCFLDTHGNGTTVVHDLSCPGVGTSGAGECVAGSRCPTRYAAESLRVSFVSKLKMAYREELGRGAPWHPKDRTGNPCDALVVETYLTCVAEEQKRNGTPVSQAAPLLAHTLEELLEHMRMRAQLSRSVEERISITRDIGLYSLAFYTMRRGFDLSCTLGSQVLQLPDSAGMIYNFNFGKTLRKSVDSIVVRADPDNHRICAFRGVRAYLTAASHLGWDLEQGHLFPDVGPGGSRLSTPVKPSKMAKDLTAHLEQASLPTHYSMHSFRVGGSLSESLAGTAVDEIMKIGGWQTERMAEHYIGATTSAAAKGKRRKLDGSYDSADKMPLSADFRSKFGACRRR